MWYVIILFVLLFLYATSLYVYRKSEKLSDDVKKLTDDELLEAREKATQDYNDSPSFWKGQKLNYFCEEIKKRKL